MRFTASKISKPFDYDWEQYYHMFTTPIINPEDIKPYYQQIAKDEQLLMDFDCFFRMCGSILAPLWIWEGKGVYWILSVPEARGFKYDWMLRDLRAARRNKQEFFDLAEYCRDPENWYGEVEKKAIPTVIELSKLIVDHVLQLPSKGKKIILNSKK